MLREKNKVVFEINQTAWSMCGKNKTTGAILDDPHSKLHFFLKCSANFETLLSIHMYIFKKQKQSNKKQGLNTG